MEVIIGLIVVIFNAGGFVWLAKNHFAHTSRQLTRIEAMTLDLVARVSKLEGRLEKH